MDTKAMNVLTVRLPERMVEWLNGRAEREGLTRSDILRLLIVAEIERDEVAA